MESYVFNSFSLAGDGKDRELFPGFEAGNGSSPSLAPIFGRPKNRFTNTTMRQAKISENSC